MAETPYNQQRPVHGAEYEPKGGKPNNPGPYNSHSEANFGATGGGPDNSLPGNVHCHPSIHDGSSPLLDLINKYGVPGLIFDNSPPTVFQDAAGSTPAVIGDVVGRVDDKSGSSHDITQNITAAKPILRAGQLLEFDGTDDFLFNNTQPFAGDELTVIWCGKFRSAPGSVKGFITIADRSNSVDYFYVRADNATSMSAFLGGTMGVGSVTYSPPNLTDKFVMSVRTLGTSTEISHNSSRSTATLTTALDLSPASDFGFGAVVRSVVSLFADIDQDYAFVINKRLTDDELAQAEQYIASLCGVTL